MQISHFKFSFFTLILYAYKYRLHRYLHRIFYESHFFTFYMRFIKTFI
nr:MAG TPA: hypothetical protein [Caudoviricetes sp.]